MSGDQPGCVLSVWTQTSAPPPVSTRGRAVRQSADLALVQVPPDTVLSLVEIMVLLRQFSYVLCHKDTAQGTQSLLLWAILASRCVFMIMTERIYYRHWPQQNNDPTLFLPPYHLVFM